ncbi:MAG: AI-2E family transporter [Neisseria sp.]|uniref:AI-2E family transporter n=1 Tax=Neisseria sp. TaxID=192066 RepID=UPI0026DD5926|nr:AI-2E family transporter [Neisseria sp.]MDO4247585.1 AI-2E family transporter [Neisseria sp.]
MYQKKARGVTPWVIAAAVLFATGWLFVQLKEVLMPFAVAATLAYILNPLVEKLRNRGMKRGLASMLVMLFALAILFALILVIVPMLVSQFQNMVARLPQLVDYLQNTLLPWANRFLGDNGVTVNRDTVLQWLQEHTGSLQSGLSSVAGTVVSRGGAVALGLTNVVLLPLLLYYFLLDWQRWSYGIKAMIPRRFISTYSRIASELDKVLGEFLRGQLMVMLIMGAFFGIGLMMVGLDSGFAIGMVAGLLVFIPYLGAFTGLLLSTVAALLQFGVWHELLLVWGVFTLGQLLESFVVTPQIVGDRIGLSPFWVILSLMAFGQLMGFIGMLIGLPLAAICLVLLRESSQAYFKSDFYKRSSDDAV